MKKPKNFHELVNSFMWLQDLVLGVRLDRKELQRRYNWSEATVDRRIADGTIPRPMRLGGRPYWRLKDIAEAELAGRLPTPETA